MFRTLSTPIIKGTKYLRLLIKKGVLPKVASRWLFIYYRLMMHGNSNINFCLM